MILGFLKNNLLLKILSLLFAILIWFVVAKEEKSILPLTVPLELKNLPQNLIISGNYPSKIDLKIQGTKSLLDNLAPGDVAIALDISKSNIGENRFFLRNENVKHPFGTEILLIEPSIIKIDVQKKIQRIIPVKANLEGQPKKGFRVIETVLEPKGVTVIGPENEIKKIKVLRTEPVNIDNLDKNLVKEVTPLIPSPHISPVTTEKIKVRVVINEITITKKLNQIKIRIFPSDYKIDYNPKDLDVVVEGPQSVINGLDNSKVSAEINISKLEPSSKDYKLTPALKFDPQVPETVTVKKMIPATIDVRIYSKK